MILRVVLNGLLITGISQLFPQLVEVPSVWYAILAAFVLAVVNVIIKPVVLILTLPITILTLGLFTLVINAVMVMLVSAIMGRGFVVEGFVDAFLLALLISIGSIVINLIITDD